MIKNLIPPGLLTRQTSLVVTNAIFFLGKWEAPFRPDNTKDEPFHLETGGVVNAPLMTREDRYHYAADNLCQALELPYRGGDLSMMVLLPHSGLKLVDLEDMLNQDRLDTLTRRMRPEKVIVSLPRFETESSLNLNTALRKLGLVKAYDTADFSGITGNPDLQIGTVLHKARVEVEETGTKAAAATAAVMLASAAPGASEPEIFRADHPFLYLIRDRASGAILFMGRLNTPVK
jgi:serpin B